MLGKVRNYFADGNTSKGFISFLKSNIDGMEHLYILKGAPGTGKSSIMQKIGMNCINKGFDVELMHSSSDNNSISGVVIPKLKFAVVDGTKQSDLNDVDAEKIEYIDLNVALNSEIFNNHKDEIASLTSQKQQMYQSAYGAFSQALIIHDEWEKIYISNMDLSKANEIIEKLQEKFFGNEKLNKKSVVRHRFLGAATPEGSVDYVDNLTADVTKRYFIKGRPGSGKSTLLKKLVSDAEQRGFDVEVYHCGFDPNSLDMVIIRELDVSIFDSTAPHEYYPKRENDEIVDMYKLAIALDTDDKYAAELQDINKRYKEKIQQGTSFLSKAKDCNDQLKSIYGKAMDYDYSEKITQKIYLEIILLSEK